MGTTNILDLNNRVSELEKSAIDGLTASDVAYDNSGSGLTATDVQGAVDELAESYPASQVIMSDGVTSVEDRLDSNTISSESAVSLAYNTEYTTLSDGYFKITCNAGLDTWATGKVNNIAVIQCTSVPTQTANGIASIFVRKGSKIQFSGKNSTDANGSFYPLQ